MRLFRKRAPEEPPAPGSALWGGVLLPTEAVCDHFLAVGATGSGKGMTVRMLMQSVLPEPGTGGCHRALVYDARQDVLPVLKGVAPGADIVVTDPLDARSAAWNMAVDIDTPAAALELAETLIPKSEDTSGVFFSEAARTLMRELLAAVQARLTRGWSLRDVLAAADNEAALRKLLWGTRAERYLQDSPQLIDRILTILRACLDPYKPIAAAWEHAERRLSLKEWLQSESILVLGANPRIEHSLKAINQALFQRLTTLLLAQGNSQEPAHATWIFLDDVIFLCPLPGLEYLLTRGRSAGARACISIHSVESLRARCSAQTAEEMLSQCQNLAVLQMHSPADAEWASRRFGDAPGLRRSVLPSEFMSIPRCSSDNGITGYYFTPYTGVFRNTLSPDFLGQHLPRPCPGYPAFIPRAEEQLALRPWNEEDDRRLGLDRES